MTLAFISDSNALTNDCPAAWTVSWRSATSEDSPLRWIYLDDGSSWYLNPRTSDMSDFGRLAPDEDSTAAPVFEAHIAEELEQIIKGGKSERFDEGMDSNFSRKLLDFVARYADTAVEAMIGAYDANAFDSDVLAETLRWLGRIQQPASHEKRRWLLERALTHRFARVRDGALIGLSLLGDPAAAPSVRHALSRERVLDLREDLMHLLNHFMSELSASGANSTWS